MEREATFRAQVVPLERAVGRLSSALSRPKDEFLRDSAIQRFQFRLELAWKVLQTDLRIQGLQARSPQPAIRGAFQVGLVPYDTARLEILELRNLTSHSDDEALAEKVYAPLPATLERFRSLVHRLQAEGISSEGIGFDRPVVPGWLEKR